MWPSDATWQQESEPTLVQVMACGIHWEHYFTVSAQATILYNEFDNHTVKCCYNAVFGVQEIDRVIAVTAL